MTEARFLSPLILASASPRRRQILTFAGFRFDVTPAHLDEEALLADISGVTEEGPGAFRLPPHVRPENVALLLAKAKALSLNRSSECPILSADTVVALDNLLLTKPPDHDAARWMLKMLSGRTHLVITAHVLLPPGPGDAGAHTEAILFRCPKTTVTFRSLSDREIDAYIETGESDDKAGAYAVQGEGSLLIHSVSGDYLNIVGLSLSAVDELLREWSRSRD